MAQSCIPPLSAAGIADGDRPRTLCSAKLQHVVQLRKARGTQNRHAGNRAEITDIEQPLVRLPVAAHKTGPVHAENNVKPHQGGVMDQHIKAALQKARIHGKDRHKALLGHAGRHGDGVALGNAHVKKALRIFRRKALCPGAAGHGRCDGDDTPVLFGKFAQVFSEFVGKTRSGARQLACQRVKGADAVVFVRDVPPHRGSPCP